MDGELREQDASMETLKLRRMQEPSRVANLLDSYISQTVTLPQGAYQVRDARELPQSLRGVITRAGAQGETWSCWAHNARVWLFICELSLALSRERGAPVLLVRQYNEDAESKDSGTWRYAPESGTWTRLAD
jgi:hypothetical protein